MEKNGEQKLQRPDGEGFPRQNPLLAHAWDERETVEKSAAEKEEERFYFIMNGIF